VLILNPFVFGTTMKVEHTSERGRGGGGLEERETRHMCMNISLYISDF